MKHPRYIKSFFIFLVILIIVIGFVTSYQESSWCSKVGSDELREKCYSLS